MVFPNSLCDVEAKSAPTFGIMKVEHCSAEGVRPTLQGTVAVRGSTVPRGSSWRCCSLLLLAPLDHSAFCLPGKLLGSEADASTHTLSHPADVTAVLRRGFLVQFSYTGALAGKKPFLGPF